MKKGRGNRQVDTVSFETVPPSRFAEAQAFYAAVGYAGKIADDCLVLAARLGGRIIGVVRLAPENGVVVLRGMMIAKEHQRRGIGTRMLRLLEPHLAGPDVYCLPHDWLERFYGQAGFARIDPVNAPPHLQQRLLDQKSRHPDLIVMARSAAAPRG